MSNKVKYIDIKTSTYYFFHDIISIENFVLNSIKTDEKSHKIILIYYIGYVRFKDLKHIKISSVNLLYLIFNKANEYFEEIS